MKIVPATAPASSGLGSLSDPTNDGCFLCRSAARVSASSNFRWQIGGKERTWNSAPMVLSMTIAKTETTMLSMRPLVSFLSDSCHMLGTTPVDYPWNESMRESSRASENRAYQLHAFSAETTGFMAATCAIFCPVAQAEPNGQVSGGVCAGLGHTRAPRQIGPPRYPQASSR